MPKLLRYFPAKDCRHRIAVLALYRALIQTARGISLPKTGINDRDGNPIVDLIRRRFHGNRDDVSLRLIYSSMTAGYKMLGMLHKAQKPRSPERKQVVEFLKRREKVYKSQRPIREAKADERLRKEEAVREQEERLRDNLQKMRQVREHDQSGTTEITNDGEQKSEEDFMIRNVAGPFDPARYEGQARSRFLLTKPRRVPVFATEAYGFPFLRYGPSQPESLSKMARSQVLKWRKSIAKLIDLSETDVPAAQAEDLWEENLEKARREEQGLDPLEPEDMDPNPQSSHLWAVHVGRMWHEVKVELLWQDWCARGEALARIVEEEKKLKDDEGSQAKNDAQMSLGQDSAYKESDSSPVPLQPVEHPRLSTRDTINVTNHKFSQPGCARWHEAVEKYRRRHRSDPPKIDVKDPYGHPIWGLTVAAAEGKLRRLIARADGASSNARFWRQKGGGSRGDDEGIGTDYAMLRNLKSGVSD